MLQQLKFLMFLQIFMHCCVMGHVIVHLHRLQTKTVQNSSTQTSVTSQLVRLYLYKCSQSDQMIYTTCKWTFMLVAPFQNFALYLQT
jgi:hypothetical protein